MRYYLAAVLCTPKVSSLSDDRLCPLPLVLFGALVSAFGLRALALWSGLWAFAVAVAAPGSGHSLIRAHLPPSVFGMPVAAVADRPFRCPSQWTGSSPALAAPVPVTCHSAHDLGPDTVRTHAL